MQEIEDMCINEERIIEIEERISILENREAVSGSAQSLLLKEESQGAIKTLERRNKHLRTKSGRRNQKDFIIGRAQHPGEIANPEDRFATQYLEIEQ